MKRRRHCIDPVIYYCIDQKFLNLFSYGVTWKFNAKHHILSRIYTVFSKYNDKMALAIQGSSII